MATNVIGHASVDIRANDKLFRKDLDKMGKDLGPIKVKADLDTSPAERTLKRLESGRHAVKIQAKIDRTAFAKDIKSAASNIKGVKVNVGANTSEAEKSIKALNKSNVQVHVDLDDKEARSAFYDLFDRETASVKVDADFLPAVRSLMTFLDGVKDVKATISIDSDTSKFHNDMEHLWETYDGQTINVHTEHTSSGEEPSSSGSVNRTRTSTIRANADTAAAEAQLAFAARNRSSNISMKMDPEIQAGLKGFWNTVSGTLPVKAVKRSITTVMANYESLTVKAGALSTAVTAAGGALGKFSGDALAIAGDITQVVGIAAAAPATLTTMGVAFTSLRLGWKGFSEVFTATDIKGRTKALAQLPPVARKAALEILGTGNAIREAAQVSYWDGLQTSLQDTVKIIKGPLTKGLQGSSKAMGQQTKALFEQLQAFTKSGSFARTFDNMNAAIQRGISATSGFTQAFLAFTEGGSRSLPKFADWMSKIGAQFGAWAQTANATGDIDRWISQATTRLQQLGSVTKSTVGIFSALTEASRRAGMAGLKEFSEGLNNVNEVMHSDGFQVGLTSFFESSKKSMSNAAPGIGRFFNTIVDGLPGINKAMEISGDSAGQFMVNISRMLESGGGAGMMHMVEGFNSFLHILQPGFASIGEAMEGMGEISKSVLENMAPGLNMLFDTMDMVVSNLKDGILDIMPVLNDYIQGLLGAIKAVVGPITSAIGGIASAFAGLPGPIQKALLGMGTFLVMSRMLKKMADPTFALRSGLDGTTKKAGLLRRSLQGVSSSIIAVGDKAKNSILGAGTTRALDPTRSASVNAKNQARIEAANNRALLQQKVNNLKAEEKAARASQKARQAILRDEGRAIRNQNRDSYRNSVAMNKQLYKNDLDRNGKRRNMEEGFTRTMRKEADARAKVQYKELKSLTRASKAYGTYMSRGYMAQAQTLPRTSQGAGFQIKQDRSALKYVSDLKQRLMGLSKTGAALSTLSVPIKQIGGAAGAASIDVRKMSTGLSDAISKATKSSGFSTKLSKAVTVPGLNTNAFAGIVKQAESAGAKAGAALSRGLSGSKITFNSSGSSGMFSVVNRDIEKLKTSFTGVRDAFQRTMLTSRLSGASGFSAMFSGLTAAAGQAGRQAGGKFMSGFQKAKGKVTSSSIWQMLGGGPGMLLNAGLMAGTMLIGGIAQSVQEKKAQKAQKAEDKENFVYDLRSSFNKESGAITAETKEVLQNNLKDSKKTLNLIGTDAETMATRITQSGANDALKSLGSTLDNVMPKLASDKYSKVTLPFSDANNSLGKWEELGKGTRDSYENAAKDQDEGVAEYAKSVLRMNDAIKSGTKAGQYLLDEGVVTADKLKGTGIGLKDFAKYNLKEVEDLNLGIDAITSSAETYVETRDKKLAEIFSADNTRTRIQDQMDSNSSQIYDPSADMESRVSAMNSQLQLAGRDFLNQLAPKYNTAVLKKNLDQNMKNIKGVVKQSYNVDSLAGAITIRKDDLTGKMVGNMEFDPAKIKGVSRNNAKAFADANLQMMPLIQDSGRQIQESFLSAYDNNVSKGMTSSKAIADAKKQIAPMKNALLDQMESMVDTSNMAPKMKEQVRGAMAELAGVSNEQFDISMNLDTKKAIDQALAVESVMRAVTNGDYKLIMSAETDKAQAKINDLVTGAKKASETEFQSSFENTAKLAGVDTKTAVSNFASMDAEQKQTYVIDLQTTGIEKAQSDLAGIKKMSSEKFQAKLGVVADNNGMTPDELIGDFQAIDGKTFSAAIKVAANNADVDVNKVKSAIESLPPEKIMDIVAKADSPDQAISDIINAADAASPEFDLKAKINVDEIRGQAAKLREEALEGASGGGGGKFNTIKFTPEAAGKLAQADFLDATADIVKFAGEASNKLTDKDFVSASDMGVDIKPTVSAPVQAAQLALGLAGGKLDVPVTVSNAAAAAMSVVSSFGPAGTAAGQSFGANASSAVQSAMSSMVSAASAALSAISGGVPTPAVNMSQPQTQTIKVVADTSQATAAIAGLSMMAIAPKTVNVVANTAAAVMGIIGLSVMTIPSKSVTITANAGPAIAGALAASAIISMIPSKSVTITANAGQAMAAALAATAMISMVPSKSVTITANSAQAVAAALLASMYIGMVHGKSVTISVVADTSGASAAQNAINSVTGKQVTVTTVHKTVNQNADGGMYLGGVRRFANGGLDPRHKKALESYRGQKENHKAQIAKQASQFRIWGEPETGGEAYIPLAMSKRSRSLKILEQVASHFGLSLSQSFADGGFLGGSLHGGAMTFASGGTTKANKKAKKETKEAQTKYNNAYKDMMSKAKDALKAFKSAISDMRKTFSSGFKDIRKAFGASEGSEVQTALRSMRSEIRSFSKKYSKNAKTRSRAKTADKFAKSLKRQESSTKVWNKTYRKSVKQAGKTKKVTTKYTTDQTAVRIGRDSVRRQRTKARDYNSNLTLRDYERALASLTKQAEKAAAKLDKLRDNKASMVSGIAGNMYSAMDLGNTVNKEDSLGWRAPTTATDVKSYLAKLKSKMSKFRSNIVGLGRAGYNKALVAEIAGMDLDSGLEISNALLKDKNNKKLKSDINKSFATMYGTGGQYNTDSKGNTFVGGIAKGIGYAAGSALYNAGIKSAKKYTDGLNSQKKAVAAAGIKYSNQLQKIGKHMTDGLAKGITANSFKVTKAVDKVLKKIPAKVKKKMKIKSPSRVMAGLGGFISEGLAVGIDEKAKQVDKSMSNLMNIPSKKSTGNFDLTVPTRSEYQEQARSRSAIMDDKNTSKEVRPITVTVNPSQGRSEEQIGRIAARELLYNLDRATV